jgi:hypothetical protein
MDADGLWAWDGQTDRQTETGGVMHCGGGAGGIGVHSDFVHNFEGNYNIELR